LVVVSVVIVDNAIIAAAIPKAKRRPVNIDAIIHEQEL